MCFTTSYCYLHMHRASRVAGTQLIAIRKLPINRTLAHSDSFISLNHFLFLYHFCFDFSTSLRRFVTASFLTKNYIQIIHSEGRKYVSCIKRWCIFTCYPLPTTVELFVWLSVIYKHTQQRVELRSLTFEIVYVTKLPSYVPCYVLILLSGVRSPGNMPINQALKAQPFLGTLFMYSLHKELAISHPVWKG